MAATVIIFLYIPLKKNPPSRFRIRAGIDKKMLQPPFSEEARLMAFRRVERERINN
jgi:hypothetical protein